MVCMERGQGHGDEVERRGRIGKEGIREKKRD